MEIRRELKSIELLPAPPMRRVRRIVGLARQARRGAAQMARLSRGFVQAGDGARAARFMKAARQLVELYEELRACAQAWLAPTAGIPVPKLKVVPDEPPRYARCCG
ncbi:MAG: hypothetical protein ACO1SV_26360 [Fimbriimonas sp.]